MLVEVCSLAFTVIVVDSTFSLTPMAYIPCVSILCSYLILVKKRTTYVTLLFSRVQNELKQGQQIMQLTCIPFPMLIANIRLWHISCLTTRWFHNLLNFREPLLVNQSFHVRKYISVAGIESLDDYQKFCTSSIHFQDLMQPKIKAIKCTSSLVTF